MFAVHSDLPLISTDVSARLLRVEINVPRPPADADRKPVHLSLVIDRSGSMAGDKLKLALLAARQAIRTLAGADRFSVVTFDHQVHVPVPSTEVTTASRARAEGALDTVTSGGNTDLGGGWLRGCDEVSAHLPANAIGRCLLLTDGQANHGITSPEELTQHAHHQRLRRVTTSTLGLGDGFNEFLLGRLSEEGGGNFYFAERADQLPGFVARELGEVLSVVARDAAIVIQAPQGVEVESLNDYPCVREGATFSFSLGSLSGGLAMAPVFRLRFPAGSSGETLAATVRLTDIDRALASEPRSAAWSRESSERVRAGAPDLLVTRTAAALDAARARRVALALNQSGHRSEAVSRLVETAALLRSYAGSDPEILAQASRLEQERDAYSRPMSSMSRKGLYYSAMLAMKLGISETPDPAARVLVLPTAYARARGIQRAVEALGAVPGAPALAVDPSLLLTSLPSGPLSNEAEGQLSAQALTLSASAIKVVVVEQRLQDGWFSHWHAGDHVATVSVADLDRLISSPVESFVAYELVLHGLRALSPSYDPTRLLHRETRACLFDLCEKKADVGIKLQAGHLCADCLKKLPAAGLDGEVVTRMWRAVQALAQAAV
jgi:Ca-activated chloride channel family protein